MEFPASFSTLKTLRVRSMEGKVLVKIPKSIKYSEYVLTVAHRPLEIATGYLNFQLVAQIGYWNKIMYFYM